jgi:hypothetical protein
VLTRTALHKVRPDDDLLAAAPSQYGGLLASAHADAKVGGVRLWDLKDLRKRKDD